MAAIGDLFATMDDDGMAELEDFVLDEDDVDDGDDASATDGVDEAEAVADESADAKGK